MRYRIDEAQKKLDGTFKKGRARPAGRARFLSKWPGPGKGWSEAKRAAWGRLGPPAIASGVTAADLLFLEYVAEQMARADALQADRKAKPTAVNAAVRLVADLLKSAKLAPATRGYEPLPPDTEPDGTPSPDAEFSQR